MKTIKSSVLISAFIASFFVFLSPEITGQNIELIRSVIIPTAHKVSIDRYNNIYLADERGNVYKYSSEGNLLLTFSPQKKSEVTLLEAWRNVNTFIFYRNFQEATLLDRFLTQAPNFKFDEDQIGFARLATFSSDNNFWVIDDRDFSLKKYNEQFKKLEINTSLDLILNPKFYDLNFMREYQNLLFIADNNSGILVFDNMGNYKNTLPFKGINLFSFINK